MKDGFQHAFDSGEDFLVPESHDGVTQCLEVPHAFDIGGDLLPVAYGFYSWPMWTRQAARGGLPRPSLPA